MSAQTLERARVLDAAKVLFLHNAATYEADSDTAESAWMLDEELQTFWVEQVAVVAQALG